MFSAKRFAELRKATGLNANEFARKAGVSHVYIQKLEEGVIRMPRQPYLEKLASALGVRSSDLLEIEDYEDTHEQHYTPQQQKLLEAIPTKAVGPLADFTRGLFSSMSEEDWQRFLVYHLGVFTSMKLRIAERQADYEPDPLILGDTPPAEPKQNQKEA